MFLDIRTTLATFCTAIGLVLVMFGVGSRAYVGVGSERPAYPRFEARALTTPDPLERGFAVIPASARSVTSPTPSAATPVSVQTFLPPAKTEPARSAERVTGRETPAPGQPSSVIRGAG